MLAGEEHAGLVGGDQAIPALLGCFDCSAGFRYTDIVVQDIDAAEALESEVRGCR